MAYVTHARTPEELKAELCSDITRRLDRLRAYSRTVAKSEAEKSRLATAQRELEDMLLYWTEIAIVRPLRKREAKLAHRQTDVALEELDLRAH